MIGMDRKTLCLILKVMMWSKAQKNFSFSLQNYYSEIVFADQPGHISCGYLLKSLLADISFPCD